MWAWGIILVLCGIILWLALRLREAGRTRSALETHLEAEAATLGSQVREISRLEAALAEAEAKCALCAPEEKPGLYLPDLEAEPLPGSQTVFFNENTGIFHADRACAPYQAIPLRLDQLAEGARPCKKCAEGLFPFPVPQESPAPQEGEDQISLFDGLPETAPQVTID